MTRAKHQYIPRISFVSISCRAWRTATWKLSLNSSRYSNRVSIVFNLLNTVSAAWVEFIPCHPAILPVLGQLGGDELRRYPLSRGRRKLKVVVHQSGRKTLTDSSKTLRKVKWLLTPSTVLRKLCHPSHKSVRLSVIFGKSMLQKISTAVVPMRD